MRLGARLQAAMEVLDDIFQHHRPAAAALSDWGSRHRFAGSGDRAAIGTLVYEVLRRKLSLASQMGSQETRALVFAAAPRAYDLSTDDIVRSADGSQHAPSELTADELEGLRSSGDDTHPEHIRADVPEWLWPSFSRAFGDRAVDEAAAMTMRAPIDLRANSLKATQSKVIKALDRFGAEVTTLSPVGVRVPPPKGAAKSPHVEADAAHGKGWFEVQDEGSQIAAMLSGAKSGRQVLDLCAGAGGKTLALAGLMGNTGQIYAYDQDRAQLRPLFDRMRRAGVRNVQVLDGGDLAGLEALGPRFDAVLVDAPCTGSGTWRRRPDTKWRLKPEALERRRDDQQTVLSLAAKMVKPGGQLTYVTCSVLPEENIDQVAWFLEAHAGFSIIPFGELWTTAFKQEAPASADGSSETLLLTPASHGTDGFFIAGLRAPPAA